MAGSCITNGYFRTGAVLSRVLVLAAMRPLGTLTSHGKATMARPPKGKPLTLRPIRLDDDVWAECQRLGKEHGTINEGLRAKLIAALVTAGDRSVMFDPADQRAVVQKAGNWKRGPRQKGDKTR